MITSIKRFFENHMTPGGGDSSDPQRLVRLAVAVLLIEVAEADYQDRPEERDALEKSVSHQFGLDASEAEELIALARQEHSGSTDYYQFTSLINSHFSPTQKIEVIEGL